MRSAVISLDNILMSSLRDNYSWYNIDET